jgi:hypothetical protein
MWATLERLTFCKSGATYRPDVTVLSGFRSSFHIAHANATEFGHALLDQTLLMLGLC